MSGLGVLSLSHGLIGGAAGAVSHDALYGPNLVLDPDAAQISTIDWSYDAGANILTRVGSSGGNTFALAPTEGGGIHLIGGATYQISYFVSGLTGDTWTTLLGGGANSGQKTGAGWHIYDDVAATPSQDWKIIPWAGGAGTATFSNIAVRQLIDPYGQELMEVSTFNPQATVDWSWDTPTAVLTRTGSGGSCQLQIGADGEGVVETDTCLVEYDVTGFSGDGWKLTVGNGAQTTEQTGDGHFSHVLTVGAADEASLVLKFQAWAGTAANQVFSNITCRKIL